ncbi:hypothetical protein ACH4MG_27265 [Streptomyces sp. NPDC017454]|uniref:hypothetical protein n=1 Tax=Streptomyces sp. NPDC017454 TaxID=3364997 RepID=UPI0037AB4737
MSAERERQQLLRAKAAQIVAGLPAWDGESPSVWVVVVDPETQQRLAHWRVPAEAAPQPEARVRHLRAVPDAS